MSTLSNAEELATRYLHEAVKKQYAAQVSGLLSTLNGIDVNVRDGYGMTALMWAAGRGYSEIASILLHKGADVEAQNELLSVRSIEKLETGKDTYLWVNDDRLGLLRAKSHHGWTALSWAARNGRTEIVSLLLDSGADVNAITKDGFTALVHAIDNKHVETAQLLLERGADPYLIEDGCSPALPTAVGYGFVDLVQTILDRSGNIDALDSFEHNAFFNAVVRNQPEVLRLLLGRGLDSNTFRLGRAYLPPLHLTLEDDALECASILLDHDADINAKDDFDGETALQSALVKMRSPRVARLLIERGADTRGALATAECYKQLEEADELIKLLKDGTGS